MRYIGIDPALTRTGLCIIDGGRGEISTFSITSNRKDPDILRQVFILEEVLKALQFKDVVVLEDFALASRYSQSGKAFERAELCGMLKLRIPDKTGLPWLVCTPGHHKGLIAGKATAHKEESKKALEEIWGVHCLNFDESDAACLAYMGKAACIPQELDKKRLSFVEKFRGYKLNREALQKAAFYV